MERIIDPIKLESYFEELPLLSMMTIATKGVDDEPHAAAVYFACDDQIYHNFFSDAESQQTLDIDHDPFAAIAVNGEQVGWQEIHGLQLQRVIKPLQSKRNSRQAWGLYQTKFTSATDLQEIVQINQLDVFKPFWISAIDNHQGFGFVQEWRRDTREGIGEDKPNLLLVTGEHEVSGSHDG